MRADYISNINTCLTSSIISGYPDGLFRPDYVLTRTQACVLMYKLIELRQKVGGVKMKKIALLIVLLLLVACNNDVPEEALDIKNNAPIENNLDEVETTHKPEIRLVHSMTDSYTQWTELVLIEMINDYSSKQVFVNGERYRGTTILLSDAEDYRFAVYDKNTKELDLEWTVAVIPTEIDIAIPTLNLEDEYTSNTQFIKESIVKSRYPYVLTFNDEEVADTFTLEPGYYRVACFAEYGPERSKTIRKQIKILPNPETLVIEPKFRFTTRKYYREGEIVSLNFATSQYVKKSLNGEPIDYYEKVLPVGKHVIEAYAYIGDVKSESVQFEFEVLAKDDDRFIDGYGYMNGERTGPKTLHKDVLIDQIPINQTYFITEEETILYDFYQLEEAGWFYTETPDQKRLDIPCYVEVSSDTFTTTLLDGMITEQFKPLAVEGYHVLEEIQTCENQRRYIIAHEGSGLLTVMYETPYHIKYNDLGDKFIIDEYYHSGSPRMVNTLVYGLEESGLKLLYDASSYSYGFDELTWTSNDTVTFDNYLVRDNQLYDSNLEKIKINTILRMTDAGVQVTADKSHYDDVMKADDHLNEETVKLYASISNYPELDHQIAYGDIQTSRFIDTYGYVDNDLVHWFEIITLTGEKYYTYRTKLWDESFATYTGYLVLEDDSLLEVNDFDEFYGGLRVYDFAFDEGKYAVRYFNMESYIYTYDMTTGEVDHYTTYRVHENNQLVSKYNPENHMLTISVFDHEKSHIIYSVDLEVSEGSNVYWSTKEFRFTLTDPDKNGYYMSHVKLVEGYFESDTAFTETTDVFEVKVNVEILNMRSEPTVDSSIEEKAEYGDVYQVIDIARDSDYRWWYQVKGGLWLASEYCVLP